MDYKYIIVEKKEHLTIVSKESKNKSCFFPNFLYNKIDIESI